MAEINHRLSIAGYDLTVLERFPTAWGKSECGGVNFDGDARIRELTRIGADLKDGHG